MRKIPLFYSVIFVLLFFNIGFAADPMPPKTFILYTEKVLDALDKVEVIFESSESLKIEAQMALRNLDINLKRYDRYVKTWPEGAQGQIVWAITEARLLYDLVLIKGVHGAMHDKAKKAADRARELFLQYKRKH